MQGNVETTDYWMRLHGVMTPGGDPCWICPLCKGGEHVYGIENMRGHKDKCPICGARLLYPFEEKS